MNKINRWGIFRNMQVNRILLFFNILRINSIDTLPKISFQQVPTVPKISFKINCSLLCFTQPSLKHPSKTWLVWGYKMEDMANFQKPKYCEVIESKTNALIFVILDFNILGCKKFKTFLLLKKIFNLFIFRMAKTCKSQF